MNDFPFHPLGKFLVFIGVLIVLIGLVLMLANKIPYLGRLPGDIVIQKKNFTFYFPITTLIVLNLLLFIISLLFRK